MMGAPLDLVTTDSLLFGTYRYAELLDRPPGPLETTARSTASTLGVPFSQMAYAMEGRGDFQGMLRYLEPAARLSANPAVQAALEEVRREVGGALQDSGKPK
jgi:hypothetical protein